MARFARRNFSVKRRRRRVVSLRFVGASLRGRPIVALSVGCLLAPLRRWGAHGGTPLTELKGHYPAEMMVQVRMNTSIQG